MKNIVSLAEKFSIDLSREQWNKPFHTGDQKSFSEKEYIKAYLVLLSNTIKKST